MVTVLKTVVPQGTVGSNPTPSAISLRKFTDFVGVTSAGFRFNRDPVQYGKTQRIDRVPFNIGFDQDVISPKP